jgi:S-formylglutathione hydrolase FrmB
MDTGELIELRWKRWLAHDPIHLVKRFNGNLKQLRGIWIECGTSDQYFIHYGTRILSKRLNDCGVKHVYEEFDDNHSDLDYRLDKSLPYLFRAISQS